MELSEDRFEEVEVKKPQEKVLKPMPLNARVLFLKDSDEYKTKGGLILTEKSKIEVLTGRIIAISKDIRDNPAYDDLKLYDKVTVNYNGAVPVELTEDNKKFFLPITSIICVWKKPEEFDLEE